MTIALLYHLHLLHGSDLKQWTIKNCHMFDDKMKDGHMFDDKSVARI
jgi:hypothetical protein